MARRRHSRSRRNPLSAEARELLHILKYRRKHGEPMSWGGGMLMMHHRGRIPVLKKALAKRPRIYMNPSARYRRNPILQGVLPAAMAGMASAVGMRFMDTVLPRANPGRRTIARAMRLSKKRVLGAWTPLGAIREMDRANKILKRLRKPYRMSARGLRRSGFAKKFPSWMVSRLPNGRHGVERAPRHLRSRPAQRLYGAKIIDSRRAEMLRDPECRQALEAHRRFHGHDPVHLTRVFQDDGRKEVTVKYGFVLGESPETTYTTWKYARSNKRGKNGKKIVYVHKNGEGGGKRPLLVHYPRSGETGLLGGTFRITDWIHR